MAVEPKLMIHSIISYTKNAYKPHFQDFNEQEGMIEHVSRVDIT